MRLPIASIVFEGDFRLGALQALSVDRLYDLDTLSEYVIILNGADNTNLRQEMEATLHGTSQKLRDKITYLEWGDLLGDKPKVGYYDQQALKLAVAAHFDTEFYLLLDSKNHFVAPASAYTFFREGAPIGPLVKTSDYWRDYLMRSVEAVGADPREDWGKMMPSVTPAVMLTEQVALMAQDLEEKYGSPLPEAMKKSRGTEFLMYYAHLRKSRQLTRYADTEMPVRTLFTSWPQDPEIVARYVADVGDQRPVFGLHRHRLPQLNDEQKWLITALWRKHLLNEREDQNWFFLSDN